MTAALRVVAISSPSVVTDKGSLAVTVISAHAAKEAGADTHTSVHLVVDALVPVQFTTVPLKMTCGNYNK